MYTQLRKGTHNSEKEDVLKKWDGTDGRDGRTEGFTIHISERYT